MSAPPLPAAALVALEFTERTFGLTPAGARAPLLGLSCCRAAARGYATAVPRALAILRVGAAQCGRAPAARLAFYRTGRCGRDAEADRRARLVRRLAARMERAWGGGPR